jgi:hypothetical protein
MPKRRPLLAALALAATIAVAGCSSGSNAGGAESTSSSGSGSASVSAAETGTSCTLSGCTVVLQQGVDARTSVLGVPVELVGTTGTKVQLKIANQQVDVPVDPNASANVGGLAVSVQSVDKDRVVLKVTAGG